MVAVDPSARAALVAKLVDWLEEERGAFVAAWRDQGVSPTTTIKRRVLRRTYERTSARSAAWSFNFESTPVEVSRLQLVSSVTSPIVKFSTSVPIDTLVTTYGEAGLIDGIVEDGVDNPTKRAALFLARLCGDYLRSLQTVTAGDTIAAAAAVESYLQFLERDDIEGVEQLAIGGIKPPDQPIQAHEIGVTVRALTPEELGELASPLYGSLEALLESSHFLPITSSLLSGLETCLLTIRYPRPKRAPAARQFRTARFMLALEFLGHTVCTRGVGHAWAEPGPRIPDALPDTPFRRLPERGEDALHETTLRHAAYVAERIPVECFEKPRSREAVSLHRFALATSHVDDAEAVIDYVIALEALLAPGSQTEVAHRFAVNGARYMADTEKRTEIYSTLKQLYDLRSKLVHGGTVPGKVDIGESRNAARRLATIGLSNAVLSGWPTAADFIVAVLSAD